MKTAVYIIGLLFLGILLIWINRNELLREKPQKWDFFFSYKMENANEVRRIAEHLMALGYRIWFAEYEVILHNYDDFEFYIRQGIENCSFGILFTTQKFLDSEYCCKEARWLQRHFEKEPWHMIEVSFESDTNAREVLGLTGAQRIVANLSSTLDQRGYEDRLLERLSTLTKLDLTRKYAEPVVKAETSRFYARCAPISFCPRGFVLTEQKVHEDGTDIVYFKGEQGSVPFDFNAYFHYYPQKAPGQAFTMGHDRTRAAELREYAARFMGDIRRRAIFLKERGLHAVWVDGRTQFALTHSFMRAKMRKYAVILTDLPRPIQLIFTFGVIGSFEDFYRYVRLMDDVIDSIRIEHY